MRIMRTNFSADWKTFKYRNDDTTETVTESQTYKLLVISLLGRFEKPRKKSFSSIGENNINRSDSRILSFGRIIIKGT